MHSALMSVSSVHKMETSTHGLVETRPVSPPTRSTSSQQRVSWRNILQNGGAAWLHGGGGLSAGPGPGAGAGAGVSNGSVSTGAGAGVTMKASGVEGAGAREESVFSNMALLSAKSEGPGAGA